jgi:Mas-related G protein-coupled receptor protein X
MLNVIINKYCLSILWSIWYYCCHPRDMSAVMCALYWVLSLLLSILKGKCWDIVYNQLELVNWC